MTKLRQPLTVEDALYKVLGALTMSGAVEATGRTAGYLRMLSDPDQRAQLTVIDMIKLDVAHMRAGFPGMPIFEAVATILHAAQPELFSNAYAISRVTCDVVKEGGDAHVALRLVSLVPFDVPPGLDTGSIRLVGDEHSREVLAVAQGLLPDTVEATIQEAHGDTVEDAVAHLDWLPGEIVLVGSSRLAQPRRLFLGSTAAKMLHELPVPMIVVPRTRAEAGVR